MAMKKFTWRYLSGHRRKGVSFYECRIVGRVDSEMLFFLPKKIRSKIAGKNVTLATLLDLWVCILIVAILATLGVAVSEKIAFRDALWQVWQTITTVGYGDGPAKSDIGRGVTVLYSVAGIVLFGKLISVHSDYREEQRRARRYGSMKNPEVNGYVILRFPGETNLLTLVSELRKGHPEVPICVVDPILEELPQSVQLIQGLHYVRGSLLSRDTYAQAAIAQSKQIIIFPDHAQGSEADATTRTVLELVENVTTKKVPIIFVLADTANLWMFDGCHAKAIHANVEVLLIAQECEDPSSAAAIQSMLSNLQGANPKTVSVTAALHGVAWGDMASRFPKACQSIGVKASPLALVRDECPNHLPDFDTKLGPGDEIILLVTGDVPWSTLEAALIR